MSKSWFLCALLVCAYCMCVGLVSGSGCVRAGVISMHNCVWKGVCVSLYIYEVLVQTFNLPQPSECAKRRLSRCMLSPPSPTPPIPSSSIPSLPQDSHLLYPSSLRSAPTPLFQHPMLRLILELLPCISVSNWRCLFTPA